MKKTITFLLLFIFSASDIIVAQESTNTSEWQGIRMSYHTMNFSSDNNNGAKIDLTSVSIGYIKSYSISNSIPIFIETGANILWARYSDDRIDRTISIDYSYAPNSANKNEKYIEEQEGYEDNINMFSLVAPINIAYKCSLNNDISILPYVGFTLRGNIIGKYNHKEIDRTIVQEYESQKIVSVNDKSKTKDYNLFSNDMHEDKWERFQLGWQIGLSLNYKKFNIGASYGKDLNKITAQNKISTTTITIGYNF